jgi:NitT/TauT family transport system substrate-binding protein
MKTIITLFLSAVLVAPLAAKTVLRVGYFPNVTHAQGVIGRTLTAQQKGWFEERLGPDVEIHWYAFNAGPSAMEAIFAGSLDLTYVGPNPSINAYIRSKGEEIRVIAGAARGGAALLVRPGSGIEKPADFKGKKLATPQLGNTQDVAARVWLQKQGFKVTQMGGDVSVLPTANPDQLSLFQQGKIDAVWTVEPWVSRIEREAGGKIYLEQKDAVTTILVSSVKALKNQPDLVKKFAQAHRELTEWINAHPAEAQALVQRGLSDEVKREIKLELVVSAWQRLTFTSEITLGSIESVVADARQLGFIRGEVDLAQFIEIQK